MTDKLIEAMVSEWEHRINVMRKQPDNSPYYRGRLHELEGLTEQLKQALPNSSPPSGNVLTEARVKARNTIVFGSQHDCANNDIADDLFSRSWQAALAAHAEWMKETGRAVVTTRATPKMAEAGLFANDNALLMSASAVDMMNAYEAMISAAKGDA